MTAKITKITAEQAARMPEWVEKWVANGLSCDPANFDEAERGVRGCYRAAGLAEPKIVLRMSSPFGAVVGGPMAVMMIGNSQVRDQVYAQVRDQVRAQVSAQVRDQVRAQVSAQVRDQVYAQVRDQVRAQVSDQVSDQVRAQVRAQVSDQVSDQVRAQVYAQVRAQVSVQVRDQVYAQVYDQVSDQVSAQVYARVRAQVSAQVSDQVRAQVSDQVRAQVYAQVRDQVYAQVYDQVSDQVSAQVYAQVYAQVSDQVRDQVRAQVSDQVSDQVSAQVYAQVRDQVYAQVRDQVYAQVRDQVYAQVRDQVRDQVYAQASGAWTQYMGGNLWSGWYAYASFMRDVLGWNGDLLMKYECDELHAMNAGWCWYNASVAAISDRPEWLRFNDDHQLHSTTGMAARWRDGWGLWRINGIEVDEQLVMSPESQSLTQINNDDNSDRKSIRIERYGWTRYLKESHASLVHHRRNDIENTIEALYQSPDGSRRLVVTCPTGRVFVLGTPNEIETCEQAQNWLGGDDLNAKSRCLGRT